MLEKPESDLRWISSEKKLNLLTRRLNLLVSLAGVGLPQIRAPLFILLDSECRLLACIGAPLFVFSPRGDESTDWQSDGTLHDSTKPWPGRSCSIIHRKGKKEKERKEGSVGVCVSVRQRGKMNETARERERKRERKRERERERRQKRLQTSPIITGWKKICFLLSPTFIGCKRCLMP